MEHASKGFLRCFNAEGEFLEQIDVIEGKTIYPPSGTVFIRPVSNAPSGELSITLGENREAA